jgi:hypothetical protein
MGAEGEGKSTCGFKLTTRPEDRVGNQNEEEKGKKKKCKKG